MKLPPFNHARKEWDRFKCFHVNLYGGLFTQFETGDLIINNCTLKPRDRRAPYKVFNLDLTCTRDLRYTFATPEGEPVSTTWLARHKNQALVIDLDKKKGWKLSCAYVRLREEVPSYASGAAIYFPNTEADPITFDNIRLPHPDKSFISFSKKWARTARLVAMAAARERGICKPRYGVRVNLQCTDIAQSPEDYIAKANAQTLMYIAYYGFNLQCATVEVPYLLVV